MSKTYSAEAIIVNKKNIGESDRLITFLSKYRGKFTAVAKGVRKVASRRGPNLDLLNHVKASFYTGKNIDVIVEVETLNTFREVKENLESLGAAYIVSELVNELLPEGQDEREGFELLLDSLNRLSLEQDRTRLAKITRGFELKLLYLVGLKPQLYECSLCGENLSGFEIFISPEVGGIIGADCARNGLFTKRISKDALKILRFWQTEDWDRIGRLKIPKKLEEEVQNLLTFYMNYVLEKDLYSEKFLYSVSKQN